MLLDVLVVLVFVLFRLGVVFCISVWICSCGVVFGLG